MTLSLDDKIRFLKEPGSYPHRPSSVEFVETHMSCVFLAGRRVYKLKKPVRFPFLDFTTLAARERNCRDEVRLNRRLAADVYLGVRPLGCDEVGTLRLGGGGAAVEWLVEMRRLPADRMLDRMLAAGAVRDGHLDGLADRLAAFYASAERPRLSPSEAFERLAAQHEANAAILARPGFRIDNARVARVLPAFGRSLEDARGALEARVRARRYVDGHGDLRPEHVCFDDPLVIFDCLEFDRRLRLVDPFDELAFLGMECAVRGAEWFGPALVRRVETRLGDSVPPALLRLYAAARALLRARLSLAHLLDGDPRDPARWEPQTDRYMAFAERTLRDRGDPPAATGGESDAAGPAPRPADGRR